MIERVVTIRPPGNEFAACFDHVAAAFAGALGVQSETTTGREHIPERSLVIGAHLLVMGRYFMPQNCVIWNTENMASPWNNRKYRRIVGDNAVWDYDRANLEAWRQHGIVAQWVPLGWHESFVEDWEPMLDGEPMHCGSINDRRRAVMDDANVPAYFGYFGERLRALWRTHGAVLNLHYYDRGIFEIVRCSQLFANAMPVLSEECEDGHWESIMPPGTFAPYAELADRVRARDWADGEAQRAAYEQFKLADVLEDLI